ncbi:MAG: aldo/keto reductase [Verrucomicrobia bacterium]|nr:aldo/keto reductase [Verrucomicrobiota bacterium]
MRELTRREFIKSSFVSAGALATVPAWAKAKDADPTAPNISGGDQVSLGNTGIKASRLAQGTGFRGSARSSAHTRMGFEAFQKILTRSLEKGVNFIDMADLYGTHPFVKRVIKDMPRKELVLLSKIWPRKNDWNDFSGGAKEEVSRFCDELGVDYIDICLIHCMMDPDWPDKYKGVRDELAELKQNGTVRAAGISCHNLEALKVASTHPWVDVILARINHMGGNRYKMDGSVDEVVPVLKTARKNGKAIIGMKIFGEGTLTEPEQKDASLQFVLGNQLVDAITVGMLSVEEVDDTMRRISKVKV